jgi:hypothetical protein
MKVLRIENSQCKDYVLNVHYARRLPPIEVAFGLYMDNTLSGVCTFSTPASRFEMKPQPYELNRLVVDEGLPKNTLSKFVSSCLKQFPSNPAIIVSYADPNFGHNGYIYQATNWIYNGLTGARNLFFVDGVEYHERTVYDKYGTGSVSELRSKGYEVRVEKTKPKHRYFYLIGSKKFKKSIEIERMPYPKGDNKRYEQPNSINKQMILL